MTQRRLVTLAFAFVVTFLILLSKPVSTEGTEEKTDTILRSLLSSQLWNDHSLRNIQRYQLIGSYAKDEFDPARENSLWPLARSMVEHNSRYLGSEDEAADSSVRTLLRLPSFKRKWHYFFTIVEPNTELGRKMHLMPVENAEGPDAAGKVGVILWKFKKGDSPQLVSVDLIKDMHFLWSGTGYFQNFKHILQRAKQ